MATSENRPEGKARPARAPSPPRRPGLASVTHSLINPLGPTPGPCLPPHCGGRAGSRGHADLGLHPAFPTAQKASRALGVGNALRGGMHPQKPHRGTNPWAREVRERAGNMSGETAGPQLEDEHSHVPKEWPWELPGDSCRSAGACSQSHKALASVCPVAVQAEKRPPALCRGSTYCGLSDPFSSSRPTIQWCMVQWKP